MRSRFSIHLALSTTLRSISVRYSAVYHSETPLCLCRFVCVVESCRCTRVSTIFLGAPGATVQRAPVQPPVQVQAPPEQLPWSHCVAAAKHGSAKMEY